MISEPLLSNYKYLFLHFLSVGSWVVINKVIFVVNLEMLEFNLFQLHWFVRVSTVGKDCGVLLDVASLMYWSWLTHVQLFVTPYFWGQFFGPTEQESNHYDKWQTRVGKPVSNTHIYFLLARPNVALPK